MTDAPSLRLLIDGQPVTVELTGNPWEAVAARCREAGAGLSDILEAVDYGGGTEPLPPGAFRFPDFVIAGGARCGTAWLRWHLGLHPRILMLGGEPSWFSLRYDLPPLKALKRYRARKDSYHFPELYSKERRRNSVVGEKSPTLHAIPEARIHVMRAILPATRIVLVVRDPVDRLWSHVKHKFKEQQPVIDALLAATSTTDPSIPVRWVCEWAEREAAASRFSESIPRWRSVYPPSMLRIFQYEDLVRNPQGFLAALLEFLELDCPPDWISAPGIEERRNRTDELPLPGFFKEYLESLLAGERERLADRLRELAA